jgi:hypothetical protein
MLIFFNVEAEDKDIGFMESDAVPRAGDLIQLIPMPVPSTGIPESHEDFRVIGVVHMLGAEFAQSLVHAGITVFLERESL